MSAIDRILADRVVVLLRAVDDPVALVAELAAVGVGVVEITMDSPEAEAAIAHARARGDVSVLAGTVRTLEDVERAVAAGAEACVGPAYVPEVLARCLELGVPAIPGAFTPTEVEAAWRGGAAMVKLFPARTAGPDYVRDLMAPLADVPLLVSGGIDAGNAAAYLRAGARAVAVGSAIADAEEPGEAARALLAAAAARA